MKYNKSTVTDFFNFIQDLLCVFDNNGNIIEVNDAVCTILGLTRDKLPGKNIHDFYPASYDIDFNIISQQLTSGEIPSFTIPLLTASHKLIPAETRFFSSIWNDAEVIISLSRDLREVQRSHDLFSKIFNRSHVIMAIMEAATWKIVDVNTQFEHILEYKRGDIIGSKGTELLLSGSPERFFGLNRILEKYGYIADYELPLKTTSGYQCEALVSIDKIDIQGSDLLLLSIKDTTSVKATEKQLKSLFIQTQLIADISLELNAPGDLGKSLSKVLALAGEQTNVSRVYIFEDSADGLSSSNTYEWCNTGIEPQISVLQNIPYAAIPSWRTMLTRKGRVFSKNISELPDDIKGILAQQNIKSVLAYPLYLENTYRGFIGFDECTVNKDWPAEETDLLRTITNVIANALERKRIFEQLKEHQIRLQLTIDSAREGIWDWNIKTGQVIYSDYWCEMLGYKPEEITRNLTSWENILHPDDKDFVYKALDEHLAGKSDYYETVHRVKTKSGEWKWILDHGRVIERNEANEPTRALGTHIDVSKQKATENELKNLIATKDKFFSIISHDLKNPFMTLLSLTELMILYFEDFSPEEVKDNLNEIYGVTKNTHTLLENLLTWARSQRGDIQINPCIAALGPVVIETFALLAPTAANKQIVLVNNVPAELQACFDEDTVFTVLRNLVTNAIKFTNTGGEIIVSAEEMNDTVSVSVADNGLGMTDEIMQKLFRIDVHQSADGTANEKGTGLGLILCKEFVEKNGGTIAVSSAPGTGSVFTFTLPAPSEMPDNTAPENPPLSPG